MKFLDINGVTTLWNKIKEKCLYKEQIQGGGEEDTCIKIVKGDYSIRIGTIYLENKLGSFGEGIVSDVPTDNCLFGIAIVHESDKSEFAYMCNNDLTQAIGNSYGPDGVCIYTDYVNVSGTELLNDEIKGGQLHITRNHSSNNEYAKPIQDLDSILV